MHSNAHVQCTQLSIDGAQSDELLYKQRRADLNGMRLPSCGWRSETKGVGAHPILGGLGSVSAVYTCTHSRW